MATTIEVLVGKTGDVEITVNGAKGKSCQKLTETLEHAFGPQLGNRMLKPEFYSSGETAQLDIQQGDAS